MQNLRLVNNKIKCFIIFFILFFSLPVLSNEKNPVFFLESIFNEVKFLLINKDDILLHQVMEKCVDFNEIAIWIAGRKIWNGAKQLDRDIFINELKFLLFKTYKHTVYNYIDSDVQFIVPKSDVNDYIGQKRIQIFSMIKKDDQNISVVYRLIKTELDTWLIFDIVFEGISILRTLQAQYSDIVKQYGLTYFVSKMRNDNS